MALFEKKYRFTSNRHSKRGMMALIFGIISVVSFFCAALITIGDRSDGVTARMGGVGFFALILGFIGLGLGLASLSEGDVFPILPRAGFTVALIAVLLWGGVIYVGITGL